MLGSGSLIAWNSRIDYVILGGTRVLAFTIDLRQEFAEQFYGLFGSIHNGLTQSSISLLNSHRKSGISTLLQILLLLSETVCHNTLGCSSCLGEEYTKGLARSTPSSQSLFRWCGRFVDSVIRGEGNIISFGKSGKQDLRRVLIPRKSSKSKTLFLDA